MIQKSSFAIHHSIIHRFLSPGLLFIFAVINSCAPKENVELRRIKDVVVETSTEPLLKANAVLYNPNKIKMTLRRIDMEVFVDGKMAARIDQELKTRIPARAEFTVPLEVKVNLKELGFLDTVLAVLGGKKMKIRYKGFIRLNHKGVPVTIPVDYQEEIRVRI